MYMLSTRTLYFKDTHRLKVKRRKKIFHANGNKKKAGVTILISGEIHFKLKTIIGDIGHQNIVESMQKGDITVVTVYAPKIRSPNI